MRLALHFGDLGVLVSCPVLSGWVFWALQVSGVQAFGKCMEWEMLVPSKESATGSSCACCGNTCVNHCYVALEGVLKISTRTQCCTMFADGGAGNQIM